MINRMMYGRGVYFAPGGVGSDGATGGDPGKTDPATSPAGDPPPKSGGEGEPTPKPGDDGKKTITLTEEELQARIDKTVQKVKADDQKKAERAKAEADAAVEAARLQAAGEYKTLYETQKETSDRLQKQLDAISPITSTVNQSITKEIATWPAEVRETDPGESDTQVRLSWVEKFRPLAQRLLTPGAPANSEPGGGTGKGNGAPDDVNKQILDIVSGRENYVIPGRK